MNYNTYSKPKPTIQAASEDLEKLSINLKTSGIDFIEWIEMPENIVTSIVIKPYEKERVSNTLKKFRLYK